MNLGVGGHKHSDHGRWLALIPIPGSYIYDQLYETTWKLKTSLLMNIFPFLLWTHGKIILPWLLKA
jgi:hypothetical protein